MRNDLIEQAPEVGLDPHLDGAFPLLWRADIERAAADDDRRVIFQRQFGNPGIFDADTAGIGLIQLAVFQKRLELTVRGIVFGAQLQY